MSSVDKITFMDARNTSTSISLSFSLNAIGWCGLVFARSSGCAGFSHHFSQMFLQLTPGMTNPMRSPALQEMSVCYLSLPF
jgi:hypothetical protein